MDGPTHKPALLFHILANGMDCPQT